MLPAYGALGETLLGEQIVPVTLTRDSLPLDYGSADTAGVRLHRNDLTCPASL